MRPRYMISLRGLPDDVELALRDRGGIRATRTCTSGTAARDLLHGWFREHGCPVLALLDEGLNDASPELVEVVESWELFEPERRQPRFLRPKAALHGLKLAGSAKRPQEIINLRRKIEAATREATRRAEAHGLARFHADGGGEEIRHIVDFKRELDGLYGDWMEGETP